MTGLKVVDGTPTRISKLIREKELPKVYYCRKCDRYTDVRYVMDRDGGRPKSYCYKCNSEMLEPVGICERY